MGSFSRGRPLRSRSGLTIGGCVVPRNGFVRPGSLPAACQKITSAGSLAS